MHTLFNVSSVMLYSTDAQVSELPAILDCWPVYVVPAIENSCYSGYDSG